MHILVVNVRPTSSGYRGQSRLTGVSEVSPQLSTQLWAARFVTCQRGYRGQSPLTGFGGVPPISFTPDGVGGGSKRTISRQEARR
jgi:hypothetical protein